MERLLADVADRTDPPIPEKEILLVMENVIKTCVFERLYIATLNREPSAASNSQTRRIVAASIYDKWFPDTENQPINDEVLLRLLCSDLERGREDDTLWRRLKKSALKENPRCTWILGCTEESPGDLEGDHKLPRRWGGEDTESNFQLLCRFHNRLKGEQLIWEDIGW